MTISVNFTFSCYECLIFWTLKREISHNCSITSKRTRLNGFIRKQTIVVVSWYGTIVIVYICPSVQGSNSAGVSSSAPRCILFCIPLHIDGSTNITHTHKYIYIISEWNSKTNENISFMEKKPKGTENHYQLIQSQ